MLILLQTELLLVLEMFLTLQMVLVGLAALELLVTRLAELHIALHQLFAQ